MNDKIIVALLTEIKVVLATSVFKVVRDGGEYMTYPRDRVDEMLGKIQIVLKKLLKETEKTSSQGKEKAS